jgi:MFS transporter, ACS family, hexuronate transporter
MEEQGMSPQMKAMRWLILLLLFGATVINYVDRQSLSLLAATIQRVFNMDDVGYGNVVTGFLCSYSVALAMAGPICDRLGVRKSMTAFICWWSLAELIPPFTRSLVMLGASRFLLGIGEAGVWVVAPKAVGELFTAEKRALAIGLYTAGATVGAVIAPPLVTSLTEHHGWQSVFLVTGLAGLVWVIPWLFLYRDMEAPKTPTHRGNILSSIDLLSLLAERNLWLLMLIRMITDPLWYFFLFWYPKYLSDVRHLSLTRLGRIAWIVYLAADLGSVLGGWASGRLIRHRIEPLRARRIVMTIAAVLIPLTPLVALAGSLKGTIIFASIVTFAHMAWMITVGATIVDLFPQDQMATAFGIIAAASGLGGLISTELIGHSIAHSGYLLIFCAMGVLHPIALFAVYLLRDGKRRVESHPAWHSAVV